MSAAENHVYPPPANIVQGAFVSGMDAYRALCAEAEADHEAFWARQARELLSWKTPFTQTLNSADAPFFKWFEDGTLNASYNCLDRQVEAGLGDKVAIIFEADDGQVTRITYAELLARTCAFANALRARGVAKGDRVVIYLGMSIEGVVAMQACARIGAPHSVVFGGFSAQSLRDRIADTGAVMVITADEQLRGGKALPLKGIVDEALAMDGCESIKNVIVYRRTGGKVAWAEGRDTWLHDAVAGQLTTCEPEWVGAEHPLFLLYTSGSTGKPKGIQHSSAGYLLNAKLTSEWVFDLRDDDVFWCTADIGWITGHSYVAYGPLAAGATIVMYEGAPMVPDGGRFWRICQDHGVTIFYTAPTAIRALMRLGDALPAKYDLSRLRLLGSVGEPINPEAWMWYHRVIGGGRCPIVDTWWQTETGAIMIAPLPGITVTKPGSCTQPLPGIDALIVDDHGDPVTQPDAGGYLVIRKPWPSMLRTIWGDNERYLSTYWERFHGRYYVAGDSAHRDADGCYWIMGRIDDVLKVSGHRLGTMEIESALVANPRVAEAAVVGKTDDIKGESVFAFVVLRGPRPSGDGGALVKELRDWVGEQLGAIAKPDNIRFADNLPKTRSGKIMRRLLRAIANNQPITQDVSTLENPGIVDQLRGIETPVARTPAPRKAASGSTRRSVKRVVKRKPKRTAKRQPPRKKNASPPKRKPGSSKSATVKRRKPAAGTRRKRQVRARRR